MKNFKANPIICILFIGVCFANPLFSQSGEEQTALGIAKVEISYDHHVVSTTCF